MDSQLQTLANTLATELLNDDEASAETEAAINALSRPDFLAMSGYLVGTEGHFLPDTMDCLMEYLHNTYLTSDVSSMMLASRLGLADVLKRLCAENDPELAGLNCVLRQALGAGHLETTTITLKAIARKLQDIRELILAESVAAGILQVEKAQLTRLAERPDLQPRLTQALSHFASSI